MVAAIAYEESRRKRVEENRKRMEALNLPLLSQALHKSPSPKSSPLKQVKNRTIQKELVVVRRSSRVANLPTPVYKEVVVDRVTIPRRTLGRPYNRHRDYANRVYASDEAREEALEKAETLMSGLESEHPAFIKSMLQSHISGGFWLGLPVHFCKSNLPKGDEVMTLIDEDGNEYPTIYLARKTGLSGGWKGFAVGHDLADGDAVIFQLIKHTAFKVYIIRANSPPEDKFSYVVEVEGNVLGSVFGQVLKTCKEVTMRILRGEEGRVGKDREKEAVPDGHVTTYDKHRDYANRVYASDEGLPVHFCNSLPKKDEVVPLVDEDGIEYSTIYLAGKTGLSGGWRGFAIAHDLTDGDALIFQLIKRTTFKVYIVRADCPPEDKQLE
ncbi:B3 domain-containing protein [Glycine max]|nr:B3 domain-containing protein [Glycine max]